MAQDRPWITATLLFTLTAAVAVATATAAGSATRTEKTGRKVERYFGQVGKISCGELGRLKANLVKAAACKMVDQGCPGAESALGSLFGLLYRRDLPDFLVYFDRDESDDPLELKLNLLMWKGKVTPFLYGARHVWAVVFSPVPLQLDARVTTIVKKEPNPFVALQSLVSLTAPEPEAKAPVSETVPVSWDLVAHDCEDLWMGWARLGVEANSLNRLTLSVRQAAHTLTITETPEKRESWVTSESKTTTTRTETETANNPTRTRTITTTENLDSSKCDDAAVKPCTKRDTTETDGSVSGSIITKREEVVVDPSNKTTQTAGTRVKQHEIKVAGPFPLEERPPRTAFGAVSAHFSNNRRTRAGFGVALGVTDDVERTALGQVPEGSTTGTTDLAVNVYALAKFYVRRPRLRVGGERAGSRPSVAVVAGTNVGENTFEEIVLGLAVGHVFGNLGFVAGLNWVEPGAGDSGRKSRLFGAVEYGF